MSRRMTLETCNQHGIRSFKPAPGARGEVQFKNGEEAKLCMEPNIGSGVQTPHIIAVIDGKA